MKLPGIKPLHAMLVLTASLIPGGPMGCPALGEAGSPAVSLEVVEKTGSIVPAGLSFAAEDGSRVTLGSFLDKPAVLTFSYYRCANICPDLLGKLAWVAGRTDSEAGRDYTLLTVSFDESDTPADAARRKRDFLGDPRDADAKVPGKGWRFLTGDASNIAALAGAVGFSFRRDGDGFAHPATTIVLSKEGRIVRYLNGLDLHPFDIDMALSEASEGRTGPTVPRALLFCLRYDPASKRFVLDIMRVTGIAVLAGAGAFFVYLTTGRRRGT